MPEVRDSRSLRRNALRRRLIPFYALTITLIAASFVWQMLHGVCPVP